MNEKIASRKKLFKVKKIMWQRRTRDLCFFYFTDLEQVFVGWLIFFIFSLLIINHKHKCIQARIFETQASWSLHSVLINDIVQVHVLVIMIKKRLEKYNVVQQCYNIMPSLYIWKLFYSICMWNMRPDETLHMKVFIKRTKEL